MRQREDPGGTKPPAPEGGTAGGSSTGGGFQLPPPKDKTQTGQQNVFRQYINAHPNLKPYAQGIYRSALDYGVDPVYFAALVNHENPSGDPSATHKNDNGSTDYGLVQINSVHIGESVPWAPGRRITEADLRNPGFNLKWAAYYFAQGLADNGYDYNAAYTNHYNPGYTGASPFAGVGKNYVPTTTTKSPTDTAQTAAETAAAKTSLFDKWAVLGADGRVKFVKINDPAAPPKNVLKYGPTPLTQSQFVQTWKQNYQDTFFSYTGRQASGKEIASILSNAPSLYTLANTLAKTKSFTSSPTYKAHAPGIVAIAKQAYGESWKVDRAFVAKAIAENWDQATLEQNIRSRPEYFQGPRFKDDVAKLSNVYQSIYGQTDDPGTKSVVDHVARDGWTQDQFAAWLRTQPDYRSSQEFKTKAISFAQQLGLITVDQVALTKEQALLGGPPKVEAMNNG